MHLSQFVEKSLIEIINGVTDAQIALGEIVKAGGGKGPAINPEAGQLPLSAIKSVDFDVAVTVTESQSGTAKANAGISVLGLGGEIQQETTNSKISRIKFQVPIRFGYLHG